MSDGRDLDRHEVVSRLLGPAGPEVSCEQCFEELDRFVDLELAGRNPEAVIPGMRAHLEGCPACAEDYASLLELAGSERAK